MDELSGTVGVVDNSAPEDLPMTTILSATVMLSMLCLVVEELDGDNIGSLVYDLLRCFVFATEVVVV